MAFLSHPVTCKVLQRTGTPQFRATAVSLNGWRSSMEDAHAIDLQPTHAFLGVFDGHAGAACAKHCSRAFTERVRAATKPVSSTLMQALCQEVDAEFLDGMPQDKSGCTGTMALVTPQDDSFLLQLFNVGDSRTLVIRDGQVVVETRDHKPKEREEAARLRAAGAEVDHASGYVLADNGMTGLAVSRAFGDRDFKRRRSGRPDIISCLPDYRKFHCREGDLVFLACDGVYDVMSNLDIALHFALTMSKPPGEILETLLDRCLKRNSQDNMTAVLLEFKDGRNHQPALEYVPGLYLPFNTAFHLAYRAMAKHARLSVAAALQRRHAVIRQANHSGSSDALEKQEAQLLQAAPTAGDAAAWFARLAKELEAVLQRRRAPVRQNVQDVLAAMATFAPDPAAAPSKKRKRRPQSPTALCKQDGFDPATEISARTGPVAPLPRLHSAVLALPLRRGKRPRLEWPPPWVVTPK